MQKLHNYIENINRLFVTGNAREHSYRGDLQDLLNKIIILNNVQNNTTNNIAKIEFALNEINMLYEIRFRIGIGLSSTNKKIHEMITDWNYLNFLATNWEKFIINNIYGKHND